MYYKKLLDSYQVRPGYVSVLEPPFLKSWIRHCCTWYYIYSAWFLDIIISTCSTTNRCSVLITMTRIKLLYSLENLAISIAIEQCVLCPKVLYNCKFKNVGVNHCHRHKETTSTQDCLDNPVHCSKCTLWVFTHSHSVEL